MKIASAIYWGVTVFLLLAAGLGLLLPGAYLLTLGGSAYYALIGLALIAAAILVLLRRRLGLYVYAAALLATILWSFAEVGFDGWALMPRVVFFAVGGVWLLAPWLRDNLAPASKNATLVGKGAAALSGGLIALAVVVNVANSLQPPAVNQPVAQASMPVETGGDWPHYGGSLGGSRFSSLSDITPANVAGLEQAWVYRTGLTVPGTARRTNLQLTPLMADGLLYGCTGYSSIFALDPVSGREVWRHESQLDPERTGRSVCRGVAFFRAPTATAECPTRIVLGTVDSKLIALDAKTGAVCEGFGADGAVDLTEGLGDYPRRWSNPTSAPTIVNGTIVIGAYVIDNQSTDVPPGVIRGYDAVSGAFKWAFDPGAPENHAQPAAGKFYTPSTPNSWTAFSGDEKLGLVYVPLGNGSPDFFGGHRTPETEKFTSAVVAIDAATGAARWSFQAVHHDLWDYDLAAQPVLVDFPTAQGSVPALIQATKTGQLFVLDRRTGAPITRVEERAVPTSALGEERASPTQPFSVEMPDFVGAPLTEADMWGLTPFDQLYCRVKYRQAEYRGIFTPPNVKPTIRFPGELGGIDWGSVAVDEARGVLIVNSNHMADYDLLLTRAEADKLGMRARREGGGHYPPGAAMEGAPYAVRWSAFLTGMEVPCQRPPYGKLTAIDLKTRKVIWSQSLGDARNSGPWGQPTHLPLPLGAPNIGGALTTGGGLVFIGATTDEMFRAFDVATGKVAWQERLPAAGHATPMSYKGADGKQYVLIAAGGQAMRTKPGDYLVAYRLP